jgi:hypothetical protein
VQSAFLRVVINGLLFNVSWFVIVMSQSNLVAVGQVIVHLCVHFALFGRGLSELRLVALITVLGLLLDQLLFSLGLFNLAGGSGAPLWLSCLWPVFATTLCHAFSSFQGRPLVAAAIGAIGGGGSYVAGVNLSEVNFGSPLMSPIVIALVWAVLFPSLLSLAKQIVPANTGAEDAV